MSPPDRVLQTNDERIAWVLAHPRMSPWLKAALASARTHDPVEVMNALEILNLLLRKDCETRIRMMLGKPGHGEKAPREPDRREAG